MEDFYNQFRDNLENRPEPQFREGDWRSLENRLDQQGGRKGGFAGWWLALPIFALLLASNLFFFLEWKHSTKNYSKVEILTDTVYQSHVIYTTDTIYQTRIVRETKIEYLQSPSFASLSKYLLLTNPGQSTPGNSASILYNENFKTIAQTNDQASLNDYAQWKKQQSDNQLVNREIAILNRETDYLDVKALRPLSVPAYGDLTLEEITLQKKKRTLNQQLYMMRPKGISVGLNAGLVQPIAKNIDPSRGYSVGMEARIIFSDQWLLWLEGSFTRTKFDTEEMDPAYGVLIIPPPADDFVFEKAEVPQPALQYSVGVQYQFNTGTKWKPTVGAGFGAISLRSYELLYEFENPIDGLEWYKDEKVKRNETLTDFLFLRSGLEYEFSDHWNWHLLGTYRTQWSSSKYKTLNNFGIQTGFQYRF